MSARPYRLYDPRTKSFRRWRCYVHPRNAHIGAFVEAKYDLKVGQVLQVVNRDTGKTLGTYKRFVKHVGWV